MGFRIQYPFMPKGILSRLTVQLNEMIENNLVWRDGVIFKKNKSRAKVISDYDSQSGLKYIDVKIYGTSSHSKQELLQKIRDKIKDIHEKSFKGINFTELVSCICGECKVSKEPHYFKMDTIINFLEKKKTHVVCDISAEEVNIDKLIGPVYTGEEIETRMKQKKGGDRDTKAELIQPEIPQKTNNSKNLWMVGLFFLFVVIIIFAVIMAIIAVIAKLGSWWVLPIVLIMGIVLIGMIGIFVLRYLGKLKVKSFESLMIETYKLVPLIGKIWKKSKPS